ncbi:unnamed protein product, partial [Iphiclides podalirius]
MSEVRTNNYVATIAIHSALLRNNPSQRTIKNGEGLRAECKQHQRAVSHNLSTLDWARNASAPVTFD